jgi:hypothetical protein
MSVKRSFVSVITALCVFSPGLVAQTLPETVRGLLAKGSPEPPFKIPFTRQGLDLDLAQMTSLADLIVLGPLSVSRTYLSADETMILTDYSVLPSRVLFQRHPASRPAFGRGLTLTVDGGTMTIEGAQVVMSDNNMELPVGKPLVLLLQERKDGHFVIVGDVQGAFDVSTGQVRHLLKQSRRAEEYGAMTPEALIARLTSKK